MKSKAGNIFLLISINLLLFNQLHLIFSNLILFECTSLLSWFVACGCAIRGTIYGAAKSRAPA